mgnify:CR=1 FL=1
MIDLMRLALIALTTYLAHRRTRQFVGERLRLRPASEVVGMEGEVVITQDLFVFEIIGDTRYRCGLCEIPVLRREGQCGVPRPRTDQS